MVVTIKRSAGNMLECACGMQPAAYLHEKVTAILSNECVSRFSFAPADHPVVTISVSSYLTLMHVSRVSVEPCMSPVVISACARCRGKPFWCIPESISKVKGGTGRYGCSFQLAAHSFVPSVV